MTKLSKSSDRFNRVAAFGCPDYVDSSYLPDPNREPPKRKTSEEKAAKELKEVKERLSKMERNQNRHWLDKLFYYPE